MKLIKPDELPTSQVSHNPEIGKKVMLDGRVVPGLTNFSRATLSSGQTAPSHAHDDMYEVFFVHQGTALVIVDGVRQELAAGDCLLVEPGEHHEVSNPSEDELTLLYFGLRD